MEGVSMEIAVTARNSSRYFRRSFQFLALVWLLWGQSTSLIAQTGTSSMSQNESIIREFIAAWSNLDPAELAGYFTDDGVYHNMPSNPVSGRENIQNFIGGFIRPWQSTEWEIISLVADGDTVVAERVDKTVVANQQVNLPVVGVFQMRNGKISEWRDYFDLNTYMEQLNRALGQSVN